MRDFEKKVIDFINTINTNYEYDDKGFLYFKDRNVAISLNEKYESSNLHKSKDYFTKLHDEYEKKGIRLIQIFDWRVEHEDSFKKIKMLLITAIGNPKKIYARQCDIREITNEEARPLNEEFHTMGHRNAKVTYGLFYKGQLVEIMSFGKNKWNRNILSDNSWEILRGCLSSINTFMLDTDPNELYFVAGGPTRLLTHFIRDYKPDMIISYCECDLFSGSSYKAAGMQYAGNTGATKYWILDEDDPETGKHGYVIPRNPSKYKEYKERSKGVVVWTCGSSRWVWVKPGYEYKGKGKEFLVEETKNEDL